MVDKLAERHSVTVVDVVKKNAANGFSFKKIFQTFGILSEVWGQRKNNDLVYLSISQSLSGNIRDFIIYLIFRNELSKMVVQLFGGAGIEIAIKKGTGLRYWLNQFFLSRVGCVVVEGEPQKALLRELLSEERIHVVENFAEDYLFSTSSNIQNKFSSTHPLHVLFLSNLLNGKGHMELIAAYQNLDPELQGRMILEIAGGFESLADEKRFRKILSSSPSIVFHGHVVGEQKKAIFQKAHVFCLPTYYPWEGQPFSILEAYASGCCVVTTNHGGIGHIFRDGVNGLLVSKRSTASIEDAFQRLLSEPLKMGAIAMNNFEYARSNFTTAKFLESMMTVFTVTSGFDFQDPRRTQPIVVQQPIPPIPTGII